MTYEYYYSANLDGLYLLRCKYMLSKRFYDPAVSLLKEN